MSILKNLKLTLAKPIRNTNATVERAFNKVIASLVEQKAMAQAKLASQQFALTYMVWLTNAVRQRV